MRGATVEVLVFVLTLAVFVASPVRPLMDSDYTVLLSENLLHRRTLAFDPASIPHAGAGGPIGDFAGHPYQIRVVDGRLYYRYPVATSLLSAPFVALANLAGVSATGADGVRDVRGEWHIQKWLASLLMAALALVFLRMTGTVLPPAWGLPIALGAALGSPVWSSASRVLWSHTWGLLLLGLALLHLMRAELEGRRLRALLLATLASWAYFVRPIHVVAVVAIGGFLVLRRPRDGLRFTAGVCAWMAAFVATSWLSTGQLLPHYHQPARLAGASMLPVLAAHLFSPSRGLLVYVPTVPFVAWLVARYRRRIVAWPLAALTVAAIVGHLMVMAKVRIWWGGFSYGPRFMVETIPWLVCLATLAVAAWRDAWRYTAVAPREHVATVAAGAGLVLLAIGIHARGATAIATLRWNDLPVSVDVRPDRVWDWRDPQFLAGLGRDTLHRNAWP
jgi:hypothetical protein